MKNKSFLITLLVLISMLNSCKKKCNCDDNYKKIPESTKEWFWFGNGSTWVYRLAEDTTVFDTLTFGGIDDRSSNKFCRSEFAPAVGCSEILTMYFKHSNAKYFPRYGWNTMNVGFEILKTYSPHGGGEFLSLETCGPFLGFPIRLQEQFDMFTLIDTFSNYKLINNTYNNVIHSTQPILPEIEKITDIWWAKNIGLLKIIKTKGTMPKTTWELINYNIKL